MVKDDETKITALSKKLGPHFRVSARSLEIEAVGFEEWLERGRDIIHVQESSLFWLGDWLNYGKAKFGRKYSAALKHLPYKYQSLVNIAFVCANVPPERRVLRLSFSHHREVGSYTAAEQKAWLKRADEGKWPIGEMRRRMREKAELAPTDKKQARTGFNFVRWGVEGAAFISREEKKAPVENWPRARRVAIAQDLKPIVDFYNRLIRA